ncbi:MAG: hypothetical protein R2847_08285 [Bacteroidia bacterium]
MQFVILCFKAGNENENPVVDGEFQRAESKSCILFLIQDFDHRGMWGANYYRKNPIGLHDVILTATAEK